MSRDVAGRVLVVCLGAALCVAVMGCGPGVTGARFDGNSDRLEDEPATDGNAEIVAPPVAEAAVSPAAPEPERTAPEMPAEAQAPPAGEDYRVITSFSDLGVLETALEGSGVARGAWAAADAEAARRCRTWGYEGAAANAPVNGVRLYRCGDQAVAPGRGAGRQVDPALWRTGEFRQVLWNFRGRARQGDKQALAMVQGMAAQRHNLARRAEGRGAKDWTHWMFAELMASAGEVRGDTWQCFAAGGRRSGKPAVLLGRLEEAGSALGVGEVSAAGVSHPAVFRASGPALRWEYGRGPWRELPHAFVIEPDGRGYRIDGYGSAGAEAEPGRAFDCQVMR